MEKLEKKMGKKIKLELYYGLICPFCKVLRKMLKKIILENPDRFYLKEILVSSPVGMIKSFKHGIHAVPTLLIDGEIIFRSLPDEEDLKRKLNLI